MFYIKKNKIYNLNVKDKSCNILNDAWTGKVLNIKHFSHVFHFEIASSKQKDAQFTLLSYN